ncbi:gamma-aminobutyric acid type B receptor subunit 2 [Lingula anatina]|uniref:Gamma-aminobutyric acid type B receptor subunit 2 n=1 Tax=Lingula anatina TaxID=7574 RepID=A0A1S3JB16_LINAN|nr:gamma-aminobutyric acid type B receptor subunit 2 [Lingula anatina]|eukprot:XP_013407592.1 gamma-aminobutyric acid type B receptor subunit 2 [Lingula anatina]
MGGDTRAVSLWAFVLGSVLSGLGVIMAVTFLIFNIKFRNMRIVKMSSPNINMLITVAGLFLYTCCVLYGLDHFTVDKPGQATVLCQVRTWIFSLSFTIMFAAMCMKSWRVHKIFKMATVKRLTPPDALEIRYDNVTVMICSSRYFPVWIACIYIYKGLILLYGTYLSWTIRHVTLPAMNDARYIILSTYTVVVCGGAATSLAAILDQWPDAVYLSIIGGVFISTTATLCVVFVPKIILLRRKSQEDMMKVSMSSQMMNSGNQSFEQIEEDMYHLVAENRTLKKSLTEKESTIKELENHVHNAKSKLLKMMDPEGRQDSGLDIDLSTSSLENENEKPGDCKGKEAKESEYASRVNSLYHQSRPTPAVWNMKYSGRGSRRSSVKSVESYANITRLRDSIALDLNVVQNLSSTLRESISNDLSPRRQCTTHYYDNVRTRQDLASAIAGSYDLADDSDTYSYVSNHLGYSSDGSAVGYPRRTNGYIPRLEKSASMESVSTLDNDKYYPSVPSQSSRSTKKKRKKRFGHWKREPRPKVYTVQDAQEPNVVQSNVAVTRNLNKTVVYDTFV